MTASFGQGWSGVLLAYGLSTGGLYAALRITGQQAGRSLWVLKCSLPVLVGSMLIAALVTEGARNLLPTLPALLSGFLGLTSLVLGGGGIGLILIHRGQRSVHQRGTRLMGGVQSAPPEWTEGSSPSPVMKFHRWMRRNISRSSEPRGPARRPSSGSF